VLLHPVREKEIAMTRHSFVQRFGSQVASAASVPGRASLKTIACALFAFVVPFFTSLN
jgi:hypothetical protein